MVDWCPITRSHLPDQKKKNSCFDKKVLLLFEESDRKLSFFLAQVAVAILEVRSFWTIIPTNTYLYFLKPTTCVEQTSFKFRRLVVQLLIQLTDFVFWEVL